MLEELSKKNLLDEGTVLRKKLDHVYEELTELFFMIKHNQDLKDIANKIRRLRNYVKR